jgi:hypothetical protein
MNHLNNPMMSAMRTSAVGTKIIGHSQVQALIAIVNDEFEVDITIKSRKRPVVVARKAFSFILRESNLSLAAIGGYISKDHATILHYLRDIDFTIRTNKYFRHKLSSCGERFDAVVEQAPEQKLEVVKRPQEYYTMREENKVLKQSINISKERIAELEEELRKLKREDDRIYDIYDMLKQRCPMGKEEELYNRLNRMLNKNDL